MAYDTIIEDGIDILVDCNGHTAGNRLPAFALRPSPVQVTWLGYPNTTGLPAMDIRLTDAIAELPEREQLVMQLYYVEELNLKEIGEVLGVSESRVSQILSTVVKKLRSTLQIDNETMSSGKRKKT